MQKLIAKLVIGCAVAYFLANAILSASLVDIAIFAAVAVIPFFVVFREVYFIGFIILRPVFDYFLSPGSAVANPNNPATILLLVIYFCVVLLNKNDIKIILNNSFLRKFNSLFMLLFSVAAFSSLRSEDVYGSVADMARLLSLALIVNYTSVYVVRKPRASDKLLMAVLASAVVPSLLGLYQWMSGRGLYMEGVNRIFGSFVHPNVFAEYLFVIFFILLYSISSGRPRLRRPTAQVMYSLVVFFLILNTFTRNVWVALFAACAVFFLSGRHLLKKFSFVFWGLVFLAIIFPLVANRFGNVFGKEARVENSWKWRLDLWRSTVSRVYEHPLTGHGLGTFQLDSGVPAHNDYLRISYELGFIGLLIYLALIGMIMKGSFMRMHDLTEPAAERKKGLAIFCIFFGFLIISMADNLARSTVVLIYAFMAAAVYLAPDRRLSTDENIVRQ